jgi:hypothetical protein
MPPSSRQKRNLTSSTVKTKAVGSSKMLEKMYLTTRLHIPKDNNLDS